MGAPLTVLDRWHRLQYPPPRGIGVKRGTAAFLGLNGEDRGRVGGVTIAAIEALTQLATTFPGPYFLDVPPGVNWVQRESRSQCRDILVFEAGANGDAWGQFHRVVGCQCDRHIHHPRCYLVSSSRSRTIVAGSFR